MVHDTADTESETEAVQEAATVPEGSGFGAENDVAPRYFPAHTLAECYFPHMCGHWQLSMHAANVKVAWCAAMKPLPTLCIQCKQSEQHS